MKEIYGNLLEIKEGIICHQVNCQGVMGAGIALQIKKKWSQVFEDYLCAYRQQITKKNLLGTVVITQVTPELKVASIFGQDYYGASGWTDYIALHKAAIYLKENYPDTPIYIPYHMGCGLAKGDWSSVLDALSLLDEHLTIVRLVSF